jgi:N6-L-threonylcarbamoyladenine synthase
MVVLGIETSCDETAVAVVTDQGKVLSHFLKSQWDVLKTYGGVVPELASRLHLDCLDQLIEQALVQAELTVYELDGIAVTTGPGLMGGLIAGAVTAKTMAAVARRPFIAVNHLEAHALTIRLTKAIEFPYLLLLVSGGHCQLLIVQGVGQYQLLGKTLDDALGEAFDKTARLLELPFPGGPSIEKLAAKGNSGVFTLPKSMVGKPHCDFSFSGLKTAVRRLVEQEKADSVDLQAPESLLTEQKKADLCRSFQETVAEILLDRCQQALKISALPQKTPLVIAGGVAANRYIHQFLKENLPLTVLSPPKELCTDNGIMVAWAGIERLKKGWTDPLDTSLYPRWPLSDLKISS